MRCVSLIEQFDMTSERPLLLYAALELRFTIERTLFEYLVLVKNLEMSKNIEKLYSAKDLKNAILHADPQFPRKLEFMIAFAPHISSTAEIRKPDLGLLSQTYGFLGSYLHAPKKPEVTWESPKWWSELEKRIRKAVQHLVDLHSGPFAHIDLNKEGTSLFLRYASGELSFKQLKQYFQDYFRKQ